jgi:ribonuclease BN (tRNA processing enzyme)
LFAAHLHGDHVFGLPGFLLNLQVSSLNANKAHAIEIYGPVGLYNYIATSLSLTNTELRKLTVEVYELHGGTQRSMRYAANRKTFAEFHHKVRVVPSQSSAVKAHVLVSFCSTLAVSRLSSHRLLVPVAVLGPLSKSDSAKCRRNLDARRAIGNINTRIGH